MSNRSVIVESGGTDTDISLNVDINFNDKSAFRELTTEAAKDEKLKYLLRREHHMRELATKPANEEKALEYLLRSEHDMLLQLRQCLLCKTNPRGATFLPCGHFDTCRRCADAAVNCPQCHVHILATVDTYL